MTRPLLFAALVAGLAGCPGRDDCAPRMVPDLGAVSTPSGFAGAGESVTRSVDSPVALCQSPTTLTATVIASGPGNERVEAFVDSVQPLNDGGARAFVRFTPTTPGLWSVSVTFGQDLGVRTVSVDVLRRYAEVDGVRFQAPPGVACAQGPWPLDRQHALCEEANARLALVDLSTPDAGVTFLDGQQLAVVDDIVWMLDGSGGALERWRYADGGLALTDRWQGFVPERVRGLHTRTSAVRMAGGTSVRGVSTEGVDVREDSFLAPQVFWASVFRLDVPTARLEWFDVSPRGGKLLAANDDAAVFSDFMGGGMLYSLPLRAEDVGRPVTLLSNPVALPPLGPVGSVPLWVPLPSASLLLDFPGGAVQESLWPALPLLRVSGQVVVLGTPDSGTALFFWR